MIDTHIHLDHHFYYDDLAMLLKNGRDVGIRGFVIPAADPSDLKRAIEIAESEDDVFFAVGAHPYHHKDYDEDLMLEHINHKKCVAVGECGLDFYRLPEDPDEKQVEIDGQIGVFKRQIDLAKRYKLPLIVHIRDASSKTKEIITASGFDGGGVLHCYNADEELLSLSNIGFYFGIGGVYTFKNAKKLPLVVPKIPMERLLLETDAPYLTPHPHRGKRNEPEYLDLVVNALSENLVVQKSDLVALMTQNAIKCFPKLQGYFG